MTYAYILVHFMEPLDIELIPPNKHGGVDRQQQHIFATGSCHEKQETTMKVIGFGQG